MSTLYLIVKSLHISAAIVSLSGFAWRGLLMLRESSWLTRRWVRIVPHVIDTVLLGSAIGLAVMSHQFPFTSNWLTAKLLALLGYIGLGMVALRSGRTRRQRAVALVLALLCVLYLLAVALTRNPLVFW